MAYKNARINKVLTNISLGYWGEGFICKDLLTKLPVPQWTGLLGEYGNAHRQLYSTRVMDRGEYITVPAIDYNISKTYVVHNHGLKDHVTERDYEEIEQPFMAEQDRVLGLKELLMIEKEYEISNLLRTVGTYASGNSVALSGNSQWSDYENSDPLKTFATAQQRVFEVSRKKVNACIMPYEVLLQLQYHPRLADKYGSAGTFKAISIEQIAAQLKIPKIYVPEASYVNAAQAETSFWGKDVILFHQAQTPMKRQRTFGYRLEKSGHTARVFLKDNPNMVNSKTIFHDWAYSWMITNPGAGYVIKNAIA